MLEEDFFIRSKDSLIPVEVKAKSGRAKSMKTLIISEHYSDIRYGIKFSKTISDMRIASTHSHISVRFC